MRGTSTETTAFPPPTLMPHPTTPPPLDSDILLRIGKPIHNGEQQMRCLLYLFFRQTPATTEDIAFHTKFTLPAATIMVEEMCRKGTLDLIPAQAGNSQCFVKLSSHGMSLADAVRLEHLLDRVRAIKANYRGPQHSRVA